MRYHIEKTVTVELLRHGKAHNQLLSPLTEYLGLCGNFRAATVRVPYEHQQFLTRLQILRYADGQGIDSALRGNTLAETADEITGIFESLPGLISELGANDGDSCEIVHLNMVLSASELAMLPFELSNVPPGCAGGEGNSLLMQNRRRVSMTRQVRNVTNILPDWPLHPRILFIVAAPGALGVPARAHADELLEAISPWVKAHDATKRGDLITARAKMLTVVSGATRDAIRRACAECQYTHVHILAHGDADPADPNRPYGLALHDAQDPDRIDIVDGKTLAALLSPLDEQCKGLPAVVTVASCDSGNVRSVISSNGSSLAHDLHRSGIPFVVASQFPLSKTGSRYIPRVLYPALLWGEDPRIAIARLRQELKVHCPQTHDWASLVCYASLPGDLEPQLRQLRYLQSKKAMDAAMSQIDGIIGLSCQDHGERDSELQKRLLDQLFQRVDKADHYMPVEGGFETEGTGMKASNKKRLAESEFKLSRLNPDEKQIRLDSCIENLRQARAFYRQAFVTNFRESSEPLIRRSAHWLLVQYLSLNAVLGEPFRAHEWGAAKISCDIDLQQNDNIAVAWGHGSLAELYLILLAYPKKPGFPNHGECRQRITAHIGQLTQKVDADDFAIKSTSRQFNRYLDWWGDEEFRQKFDPGKKLHGWYQEPGIKAAASEVVALLDRARRGEE